MIAAVALGAQAHYVRFGVVQISLANLLIVVAMVIALVLALVVPFPKGHDRPEGAPDVRR